MQSILTNYQPNDKFPIKNNDMVVEFVVIKKDIKFESPGLTTIINEEDLLTIVEMYNEQEDIIYKDKK